MAASYVEIRHIFASNDQYIFVYIIYKIILILIKNSRFVLLEIFASVLSKHHVVGVISLTFIKNNF